MAAAFTHGTAADNQPQGRQAHAVASVKARAVSVRQHDLDIRDSTHLSEFVVSSRYPASPRSLALTVLGFLAFGVSILIARHC